MADSLPREGGGLGWGVRRSRVSGRMPEAAAKVDLYAELPAAGGDIEMDTLQSPLVLAN